MTVLNKADKIAVGGRTVDAVYAGSTKVWPAFSPAKIPGLKVWLDASQLALTDGQTLTSWPDLSGTGHNGAIYGTPGPNVRTNALKGQRVVRFIVSGGRVRITNTGTTLNYTVIYVARMLSLGGSGGQGRVLTTDYPGDQGNNNWLVGFHTIGYNWFYDNGNVNAGSTPWDANGFDIWKLYTGDSNVTNVSLATSEQRFFIDGVLNGDRAGGSGVGMGGRLNLSGYAATEETCDCEVAEVLLYDHALPDADRQAAEGYLRKKWLTP